MHSPESNPYQGFREGTIYPQEAERNQIAQEQLRTMKNIARLDPATWAQGQITYITNLDPNPSADITVGNTYTVMQEISGQIPLETVTALNVAIQNYKTRNKS